VVDVDCVFLQGRGAAGVRRYGDAFVGAGVHGGCRKILGLVTLPDDVERRGDRAGETGDLEALWLSGDCSPELRSQTARSGRGWIRRHGAHGDRKVCQGGAQRQEEDTGADKELRESRGSPGLSKFADSNGGAASSRWHSLAALGFREERGNGEGVEGIL
jgi:hypothetical protein